MTLHVTAEENAFEKHVILAINIVIAQIVILITSSSLCDEMGKIWRMVIRKKYHVSSLIQDFLFNS